MSNVDVSKLVKALYSAAIALLGDLAVTLTGKQSFGDLTTQQWMIVLVFTLSAFGGTYGLAGWSGPNGGAGASKP
jgi:hypothetical protein